MEKLNIRDAVDADFEEIMKIYGYAQDYMIRTGNPTQWGHAYPDAELIRSDIRRKVCKVICDGDEIHGVFALFDEVDPNYRRIENGSWLNDDPYIAIHRVAGDGQVHGLFRCAADHCKRISGNIRIDTHADNHTMQSVIEKNGFVKCGVIHVEDGSPRIAYQWCAVGTARCVEKGGLT